jgi:hypothetical protein
MYTKPGCMYAVVGSSAATLPGGGGRGSRAGGPAKLSVRYTVYPYVGIPGLDMC